MLKNNNLFLIALFFTTRFGSKNGCVGLFFYFKNISSFLIALLYTTRPVVKSGCVVVIYFLNIFIKN